MENPGNEYNIGIRKTVEALQVKYWLLINAKRTPSNKAESGERIRPSRRIKFNFSLNFFSGLYWNIFVLLLVLIGCYSTPFLPLIPTEWTFTAMIFIQLLTIPLWVDFIVSLVVKVLEKKKKTKAKGKPVIILVCDGISLLPFSLIALFLSSSLKDYLNARATAFFRLFGIIHYFSKFSAASKDHWKTLILYTIMIFIAIIQISSIFVFFSINDYSPIAIQDWNATNFTVMFISWYYNIQTAFGVVFGDVAPDTTLERIHCMIIIALGCILTSGCFTCIVTTAFSNKDRKRECFRDDYETTMKLMKMRKIDKKIQEKISGNMLTIWRYKKGFSNPVSVHFLPKSLQKEIYFDINFGLLNRSLVFSIQPRSFLRSVSLYMQNMSLFPGDIVREPFGVGDAMLCVSSGVIEILSEENDESILFSLTCGTIIGEAALFIPIPNRCVIKAATYVELQVLRKISFSRLALKYPQIIRSMRLEIFFRLRDKTLDVFSNPPDLERRKETKKFLENLRRRTRNTQISNRRRQTEADRSVLNMYVLSENIPQVKTLPINLIRKKPWILRPDTPFTELWKLIIVVVATLVVFLLPVYTAFNKKIEIEFFVYLYLTESIYIMDLIFECTTAIERKDHFTYVTSIREIIGHKLKTIGFYLDLLAAYEFGVYRSLLKSFPENYATLLLSLNKLLKIWRVVEFFNKLENNMKSIILLVITTKYFYYISAAIVWGAVLLYVEACPSTPCERDRWFGFLEQKNLNTFNETICTQWELTVSLYYSIVVICGVVYGDISPKSVFDCFWTLICLILGVLLMILSMAQISSTFKHLSWVRSNYQKELFAVDQFMSDHDIPKNLRLKVRSYMRMHWNYDKGFTLMRGGLIDGLPPEQRHIIIVELMKPFFTVPLFQETGHDFLKQLAKSSRVRILPPYELIVRAGSTTRDMFLLENGYCKVTMEDDIKIIGPVNAFGYLEMILGTPQKITVETLTHCRILNLPYQAFLRAITKYPNEKNHIDELMQGSYKDAFLAFKPIGKEIEGSHAAQKIFNSKNFINVYKYHKNISMNYWQPFGSWGRLRFLQFLVVPIVMPPNSLALKIWMAIRLICVLLVGIIAPVYFSLSDYLTSLYPVITCLQVFGFLDIYIMMHVAYYNDQGVLIIHPSKTVIQYLRGSFILDLATIFPYYSVIKKIFPCKGRCVGFIRHAPGLIIVFQFYKFVQSCYHLEKDIIRKSEALKILKFVPLALITGNLITGVVVLLECHGYKNYNSPNDPKLAKEWKDTTELFCSEEHLNSSDDSMAVLKMYLITLYWVTQTMIGCGFGDITPHSKITMIAAIVIIILGVLLYGYMFGELTSGLIIAHIPEAKYRRRLGKMSNFMKSENVDKALHKRILQHYEYNWQRTEGAQPQQIFTCVHSSLRQSIITSMYESTVKRIPRTERVENVIIRTIGQQLNEMYFLKGETIVNYKDIQEYFYIVYRGRVDLLSQNGELIKSMESGGLFGNISNQPFSVSSVVAVAVTNADVLRFNSKTFFKALQLFPETRAFVRFLTRTNRDYIEPLDPFPVEVATDKTNADMFKYTLEQTNSNLYLKGSIYKHRSLSCWYFVILPEKPIHIGIEIIIFVMAYFSSNLTIYMFAFQATSAYVLTISYVLDILFLLNIFLHHHLSYFDKFGDYVIDKNKIKKRYYKSKKIIFDILSALPLEIFAFVAPRRRWLPLFLTLRLNKILRLNYLWEFPVINLKTLTINKIFLEIIWIVVCFTLMLHIMACFWFFVVCPFGECYVPCFLSELDMLDAGKFDLYIVSLYYIVVIVPAAAVNGLPICSIREVVASIILLLAGRFGLVLLFGSLISAINARSLYQNLYQQKVATLRESLCRQNISEYQIKKLWNYLKLLWQHNSGEQIPKFIEFAPYAMKCEVMTNMFGKHLYECYAFSELENAFLRQLATHLKRFVYFAGNYIVQQGDTDQTMYFIHKGKVSVLTIHPDLMETVHFTLAENDQFGLTQGLSLGKAHTFSYRAETDAVVLSLTLGHWHHLLKYFPDSNQKIYKQIETVPYEKNDEMLKQQQA